MSKLKWDLDGERLFETGVDHGVLYLTSPNQTEKQYDQAHVWNGLVNVNSTPSGAESNPYYADNMKYVDIQSAEEFKCTIEAFTYPRAFNECNGVKFAAPGVGVEQQRRRKFGMSYRTLIGNDIVGLDYGYKLHLVYGGQAAPSERGDKTVNESPEPITFSWEVNTTPVNVLTDGYNQTAKLTLDSTNIDKDVLTQIEDILYGTDAAEARLPLPDEIFEIAGTGVAGP